MDKTQISLYAAVVLGFLSVIAFPGIAKIIGVVLAIYIAVFGFPMPKKPINT